MSDYHCTDGIGLVNHTTFLTGGTYRLEIISAPFLCSYKAQFTLLFLYAISYFKLVALTLQW